MAFGGPATWSARGLSLALALVAGALFIAGVVTVIPWSALPAHSVPANSVFTPEQLHHLRSFASDQRHLAWLAYFLTIALALVLAVIPRVRRAFVRLPGPWVAQVLLGTAIVVALSTLVALPFDWWTFQNARHAGVSVESTGLWWRDLVVAAAVGWVPSALAALVVVGAVRRFPRTWPLVLASVAAAAVIVGSLILPVVVEPLFSSTRPLPQGPLRTAVLELARREHVSLHGVVVADASVRTTAENAEVTGFGPTERLELDDTLLRSMDLRQLKVVVAHELGHAANHDVLTGTLLGSLGAIAGIGLAGWVLLGLGDPTWLRDARVVPTLFAMVTVGSFVISPLESSMSRAIESRADRAALTATKDPTAFVSAQKQLDLAAHLDPTPPAWSQLWWGTHPGVLERIGLAR